VVITEKQVFAALPRSGFLRSYVEWGARWLGSSTAFHVPAALALLSQTVPTSYNFPWNTPLRTNLFALLVGPSSSSGKSRTIEAAERVLDDALPESTMPRPGSPEACVDALEGRPQILFYGEFGAFLQGTTAGQLSPLRMILTDLYDCQKVGRNLVLKPGKKPRKPEPNPRLSILGGVTPGLLEAYTGETDWSEGFLARFYTIFSDVTEDREIPIAAPQSRVEREELVKILKSYAAPPDIFNGMEPKPCEGMTLAAEIMWRAWSSKNRKRARLEEQAIKAAVHRAEAHCLKIAMLLSWDYGMARSGEPWRIDTDTLEPAITFTEWHIESVGEIADGLAGDRDMREERRMYRAIEGPPITYSDALRRARLTKRRGDEMIASLLEKKMIRRIDDSDMTAPVRYVQVRTTNVIPFPEKTPDTSDPF
jgi:hypothetical protein